MISDHHNPHWKSQKNLLAFEHHLSKTSTSTSMEARVRRTAGFSPLGPTTKGSQRIPTPSMAETSFKAQREEREYLRSFSNGGAGKRAMRSSYFSLESLFLLVCLTASLLILPLILPPLPPPPFLLLLLPIGILALLMILAFMPSNVRDLTYTYM